LGDMYRCEDNIKVGHIKTRYKFMKRIRLNGARDQVLMDTVMNVETQ